MNRNIKNIAAVVFFALLGTSAIAQVSQQKIGQNPLTINPNAALEIESTNKGLLLPRLSLEATNLAAPLIAHVQGMTIYNTATAGTGATAVTPGYYYNDGTKWVRIATGNDAKNEPWFIQNTSNEATANTDNIYQQGKVAVGFTDADAVSEKQLEVKGDFKAQITQTDGTVLGTEINNNVIDPTGPININYVADNIDLSSSTQMSMNMMSKASNTIVTKDGDKNSMLFTTGEGGMFGHDDQSAGDQSFIRVMKDLLTISQQDNFSGGSLAAIELNKNKGITFAYNGSTSANYTFPLNNGTANQVLTTDGNSFSQLSWQDASSLVDIPTEPWKIQNTTNDATANTDNIYQQGKVAVGFTDADAVSDKQLEVKGDMKAVYDNGAGTYNIIDNNYDYYMGAKANMMLSSDDEDVNSATKANFVYSSNDISNSGIVSVDGGLQGGVFASTNTILGHAALNAIDKTNDLEANVGAHSYGRVTIFGGSMSGTGNFTEVMVDQTDGIRFRFADSSGSNTGQYLFPKTNGSANQVLTTNGNAGVANLSWQDVSTLAPEPWRVQGTTNEATANTENIFQLGSVAIGANTIPSITTGSGTVNPMLHVAGDVSTTGKFYTTSSVYADYVFEKYFDGTSEINDEYEFKSLDYIKAFIEENKHLPGVTKIEDLLKGENGYMFDMTELSIQQLEKIEELFLHVIEQNQQIIELKNQVEDNNKRLEILENLLLENNSK